MATVTLRPNGAGTVTQFIPSSGNNFDCVKEVTSDSDSTYVYMNDAAGITKYDLYTIEANSIGASDTINSVTVYAYARYVLASHTGGMRGLTIRENSTTTTETMNALTSSYNLYSKTWTVRPSDSAPFVKADINSLEIGIALANSGLTATSVRCTQVYVVVNYTPSGGGSTSAVPILIAGD